MLPSRQHLTQRIRDLVVEGGAVGVATNSPCGLPRSHATRLTISGRTPLDQKMWVSVPHQKADIAAASAQLAIAILIKLCYTERF